MNPSSRRSIIFLSYVLTYIAATGNPMILPCLPAMVAEFQLSALQLGLVISFYALPGIFIIPVYGLISDRIGRRPLLYATLILCVAGSLMCFLAPTFSWLLVGRVLQGLSITPLESLSNTLATDICEGEERKRLIGRIVTVQYFGVFTTPLIVTALLLTGEWRTCFLVSLVLALFSLAVTLFVHLPYTPSKGLSFRSYALALGHLLGSRRLLSLFSVRSLNSMLLFGVIYTHTPLLVSDIRPDLVPFVGILFSIYAFGMFLGSVFSLKLTSSAQKIPALLGGLSVTLSYILLYDLPSLWLAGAGMLLTGIGTGMLNATCVAHVSLATTPDTRGSIMSAYSAVFRASQAIAPILCGLVYQAAGGGMLFKGSAVAAAVLTVIAIQAFSRAQAEEHL